MWEPSSIKDWMLRGSLSHLKFRSHKSNQLELMCEPHELGQTIYWLSAKLASADSLLAKSLICSVDYDIMHCHFGHPSKNVLWHASETTLEFPSITFSHKEHICPRCYNFCSSFVLLYFTYDYSSTTAHCCSSACISCGFHLAYSWRLRIT